MSTISIHVPWGEHTALGRRKAFLYVCASIAFLLIGVWIYNAAASLGSEKIIAIELGGSGQKPWPLDPRTSTTVRWDFALIVGYGGALWFAMLLARRVFWSRRGEEYRACGDRARRRRSCRRHRRGRVPALREVNRHKSFARLCDRGRSSQVLGTRAGRSRRHHGASSNELATRGQ